MMASSRLAKFSESSIRCGICGRFLDTRVDPLSGDTGGDCWGCIGHIEAQMGGDPGQNISIDLVAKEIRWGWREGDGAGKRPEAFSLPSYIRVRRHAPLDEPIEMWSELDEDRHELRKLEFWRDGGVGYASKTLEVGGTCLTEVPIPMLDKITSDPQLEPEAVSRDAFEAMWKANVS